MRRRLAQLLVALAVAAIAVIAVSIGPPRHGTPLWPGARYTREDRDRALRRGLDFIYHSIARNPADFSDYGHDLLLAFYNIAVTSADPELSRAAWNMGHESALEFRRVFRTVSADEDVYGIQALILGDDMATRLGVPDPRLHAEICQAAARLSVYDHLLFDPRKEPPPADLPELCKKCGRQNARGATVCERCGTPLKMRDRYDIYQDALIATYNAGRAGISLGASYGDVLRWLPALRPYPPRRPGNDDHYYAGIYAATHVCYTWNRYSQFRLSPDCFPQEFAYLKANLPEAIRDQDPETMGEYLDSLRAFGLTLSDPLIRTGFDYLLSVQNPDGSWDDPTSKDVYARYHPTWTAIDGLRDYRWKVVMPCPAY